MTFIRRWARSAAARVAFALALLFAIPGAAAAATFVDTGIRDLTPEERVKIADPKPVQVLFQFTSKGAANPRATAMLKQQVLDAVKASGLFSEVSEGPVQGGAVLNVLLDNVPSEGAAAQGFATGLTFGLKGSLVSDFYLCKIEYLSGPEAQILSRNGRHALHTTIGLKDPPPNGVKAKNLKVAVETMTRQVVEHVLNDLGGDPAFAPGGAVLPAVDAAPVAAEAAPASASAPAPVAAEAAPASAAAPAPAAEVVPATPASGGEG